MNDFIHRPEPVPTLGSPEIWMQLAPRIGKDLRLKIRRLKGNIDHSPLTCSPYEAMVASERWKWEESKNRQAQIFSKYVESQNHPT